MQTLEGGFRKIIIIATLLITGFILAPQARAQEKVSVHLFHQETCKFCKAEIAFLEKYTKDDTDIIVHTYELSHHQENAKLVAEVAEKLKVSIGGVPFTIIGDKFVPGFNEASIRELIDTQRDTPGPDIVQETIEETQIVPVVEILQTKVQEEKPIEGTDNLDLKLPIIGQVDPKKLSLPMLTIVIGLLDGFNPCAMWTLLFLISILLGMKDRLKMWVLGSAFIITSGAIYYLFLAAWLNIFLLIGYISVIRYAIGIAAIAIGSYYIYGYIKNKDGGCEVTKKGNRKDTLEKIKKIAQNKNFLLSLLGIILLAIAVNAIELLCSAGLPAIYTNILAMNELPKIQYYLYLLIYVIVFMLDDLVVFIIAMTTLRAVGIESKYAAYSHLVGGIITILIGFALLFNPAVLSL